MWFTKWINLFWWCAKLYMTRNRIWVCNICCFIAAGFNAHWFLSVTCCSHKLSSTVWQIKKRMYQCLKWLKYFFFLISRIVLYYISIQVVQQKKDIRKQTFKSCNTEENMNMEGNEASHKEEILNFSLTFNSTVGKTHNFTTFTSLWWLVVLSMTDQWWETWQKKGGRGCFQLQSSSGCCTIWLTNSNHAAAAASASASAIGEEHNVLIFCFCVSRCQLLMRRLVLVLLWLQADVDAERVSGVKENGSCVCAVNSTAWSFPAARYEDILQQVETCNSSLDALKRQVTLHFDQNAALLKEN